MDRIQGRNFYSSTYFRRMGLYRRKAKTEWKTINKLQSLHQTTITPSRYMNKRYNQTENC